MRDNKRVFRHIAVFLVGAAVVGYGLWLIWPPLVLILAGGSLMMLAANAYAKIESKPSDPNTVSDEIQGIQSGPFSTSN